MAAGILTPGSASALLLLAALATCAGASDVTTRPCKADGRTMRVRNHPKDFNATVLFNDNCSITRITIGDFDGLPNLEFIRLNNNDIISIDTVAFQAVPKLKYLNLAPNKLREMPVFAEQSCPSLVELHIATNLLTSTGNSKTFAECTRLEILSLSNNNIEYLPVDVFSPLTELKKLYLGNNKLTFIPRQMFLRNRKLDTLSVDRNRLAYLPSDFLATLGSRLDNFYFGGNPWQCACLVELLAEVKGVGVSNYKKNPFTNIVQFNGTHPQCVFIRYPCHRGALSLLPAVRK